MSKAIGLYSSIQSNKWKTLYLLLLFPISILFALTIAFTIAYNKELVESFTATLFPVSYEEGIIARLSGGFLYGLTTLVYISPILLLWLVIGLYFQSRLIMSFAGAKPITRKENPYIYNLVENLCISKGLPVPSIGIMDDDSLNAFATGWNPESSWIVVSKGLVEKLDKRELEAVIGHEMTHIINKDVRILVVATLFAGIITTIAEIILRAGLYGSSSNSDSAKSGLVLGIIGFLFFLLGVFILPFINLAISRKREYLADAGSVELTKDNEALIGALQKISGDPVIEKIDRESLAAMCIENPSKPGFSKRISSYYFSTHPPVEDRIAILRRYI